MCLSLASTHLPVGGAQLSDRIRLRSQKVWYMIRLDFPKAIHLPIFFSYNHLYSRCSLLTRLKITAHQHSRCNRWKLPPSCWFRCFSAIFHDVEQKCCGIVSSERLIPTVISLLQFINLTEGKLLTFILSPFSAFQEIIFVWLLRSLNNLREI